MRELALPISLQTVPELLAFRQADSADAEPLAGMVADAFDAYRAFAPAWQPPPPGEQLAVFSRWIGDPEYWAELATDGERIAGFATFIPARRHARLPDPDPALAHLGHLFIAPAHWGSGLATELIGRARKAAGARDFSAMRLFVVTGQARARRFYEREGFAAVGKPFDPGMGLPTLIYRRSL